MRKFLFKSNFEKNRQNALRKKNTSSKYENNINLMPLSPSLSLPAIKIEDNRRKPYIMEKRLSELKNYNKKTNVILKRKNYLTPVFKDSLRIKNNFFNSKDPNETLYSNNNNKKLSSSILTNSYNILNKNLYNSISNIKNEDHIKDLLNYGNRENLYNYIGKKGCLYKNPFSNFVNQSFSKMIKEKISNDDINEYYINNGWSVMEYSYKEEPNLKHRPNMEDKSKSIDGFNNNTDSGIFCIFDGHGGSEVSSFLQRNIINYMREYSSNFDLMFQKLDENFLNNNFDQIGSTGCIIYITKEYTIKNPRKIYYCVNIGDTRAVLINKEGAKRISYDDRATDNNESERVKKMGGIIFGGRVFGNLMLTRAFGDNEFKQYGVICNPHITKNEIDIDDKYIVLASDGVWDVMNENEIFELSKECKNSKEFCDMIVKNSLIKGSMDNISCFVIRLN